VHFFRIGRRDDDHVADEQGRHQSDELEHVGDPHFDLFEPRVDDDIHPQGHPQQGDDAHKGQVAQPKPRHTRGRGRVAVAGDEDAPRPEVQAGQYHTHELPLGGFEDAGGAVEREQDGDEDRCGELGVR
jgi:hypothetical protein